MNKRIKTLAISTFLLTSTFALAGCRFFGGDTGDVGDKIELKIGFWPTSSDKRDVAMYNVWKEKFEKDNPEYVVTGDPYTYSKETIGTKYATDTLPMVYQTWFTEPETLLKAGYIRDITDLLNEFGWTDKMDVGMRDTLTFDGKIYGIPRDGYGLGLLINTRILGDNGLLPEKEINGKKQYVIYNDDGSPAYPTTFEEIYEAASVVVENSDTKGMFICSANKNGGWQLSNMAWNYGATLEKQNASGKWASNLTDPGMVSALNWIQKMKQDQLIYEGVAIAYDDWPSAIGEKVAMAIVGSDIIHLAKTTGDVNMDDLAFVPMPTGDGEHHYSLYGGTPFVFNKKTTDEQVRGILKFFDYIGRSPSTSENNFAAIKEGYEVAKNKNQPIVPKIMPWKNDDYLSRAKAMENEYISINMANYREFFDTVKQNQHAEVPVAAQKMYEILDDAIQEVLRNPDTANVNSLLTTANSRFQEVLNNL